LQLGLTVQGIGVDIDLGVEAVQIAIGLDDQRIDLEQGQVVILEQLAEADKNVDELLDLRAFKPQPEGQVTALVGHRADQRIDGRLENLLRSLLGDLLDFDTTLGGCHEYDTAAGTIDHGAEIQL